MNDEEMESYSAVINLLIALNASEENVEIERAESLLIITIRFRSKDSSWTHQYRGSVDLDNEAEDIKGDVSRITDALAKGDELWTLKALS